MAAPTLLDEIVDPCREEERQAQIAYLLQSCLAMYRLLFPNQTYSGTAISAFICLGRPFRQSGSVRSCSSAWRQTSAEKPLPARNR